MSTKLVCDNCKNEIVAREIFAGVEYFRLEVVGNTGALGERPRGGDFCSPACVAGWAQRLIEYFKS